MGYIILSPSTESGRSAFMGLVILKRHIEFYPYNLDQTSNLIL